MDNVTPHAPIFVTGMHRSGTSATAGLLARLGVCLGDDYTLYGPDKNNPTGYYERRAAVTANDQLLERVNAAWDVPPDAASWQALHDAPDDWCALLREAVEPLARQAGDQQRPWGIKDPRISLTWPVWLKAFPDARIVICVRDPLPVAHSLSRRGSSPCRMPSALTPPPSSIPRCKRGTPTWAQATADCWRNPIRRARL